MLEQTQEAVLAWLKNTGWDERYELLEWAGKPSLKSKFRDKFRGVEFPYTFGRLKWILLNRPHTIFSPTQEEVAEKKKKTCIEKYGCGNVFQRSDIMAALRGQQDDIQQKRELTNLERYGGRSALENKEVKTKALATNKEKYGDEHPQRTDAIKKKALETSIRRGNTRVIDGKTIKQIAMEKNLSTSHANFLYRTHGEQFVTDFKKTQSAIEQIIEDMLRDVGVKYEKQFRVEKYSADFYLPEFNLILECDGMYWHSEAIKSPSYHADKKKLYNKYGFASLFFREDEILNKQAIVKSILLNKLNKNVRVFARKLDIKKISIAEAKLFFERNHLMSDGSGVSYALVDVDATILACIQVRHKNKKNNLIEISRFCTLSGTSVVGGFSKLLKHVIKELAPVSVMTFIDLRYGSGKYLLQFGFVSERCQSSFGWTDFKHVVHRMNFPGNSGYFSGWTKIWDCGQEKFVLTVR